MGLPLFVAPPSPTRKNATTNHEKEVAQLRSTIRRQRTVRGTPNWALSEIREAAASNRRAVDRAAESINNASDTSVTQFSEYATRRFQENRQAAHENRLAAHRSITSMLHPPAPVPLPAASAAAAAAPAALTDTEMEYLSNLDHERNTQRPSFMEHYDRMTPEHRRSFLDHVRQLHSADLELPPIRDSNDHQSEPRSVAPPLPPYTIGFTPAAPQFMGTSNVRSSSHQDFPERSTLAPSSTRPDYSSAFERPRAIRRARISGWLAQRSRRIRARGDDLPDGLGDRDRSVSPDNPADWDTLSVTLTPDPQAPSTANSSFASASTNPSTAVASAASSTSGSHSSATSMSATSTRPVRYNPFSNTYQPRMSPLVSTRFIPDFSIPRGDSTQEQNAEQPIDLCDSGDEFESPETGENHNMTAHDSDGDEDFNVEEEAAAALVQVHSRHALDRGTFRSFAELLNDVTDLSSRPRNEPDTRERVTERESTPARLYSELRGQRNLDPTSFMQAYRLPNPIETAAPPTYQDSSRTDENGEEDEEEEGEEERMLGGMRRIIRAMAQRDDIPDEWWTSVGLSRTVGVGAGAGARTGSRERSYDVEL